MTQVLVFGMHRSGTTLMADVLSGHDDVRLAVNEAALLAYEKDHLLGLERLPNYIIQQKKGRVFRARNVELGYVDRTIDLAEDCWVAKMSYPGPVILKDWMRRTEDYASTWLNYFGKTARIVHVVRHPFSVFLSMRDRWSSDQAHLANYGPISLDGVCRDWVSSVEAFERAVGDDGRAISVCYEDLVSEPRPNIERVFRFCDLEHEKSVQDALSGDVAFFGKFDRQRAWRHERERLEAISRATAFYVTPLFQRFGYSDRVRF